MYLARDLLHTLKGHRDRIDRTGRKIKVTGAKIELIEKRTTAIIKKRKLVENVFAPVPRIYCLPSIYIGI